MPSLGHLSPPRPGAKDFFGLWYRLLSRILCHWGLPLPDLPPPRAPRQPVPSPLAGLLAAVTVPGEICYIPVQEIAQRLRAAPPGSSLGLRRLHVESRSPLGGPRGLRPASGAGENPLAILHPHLHPPHALPVGGVAVQSLGREGKGWSVFSISYILLISIVCL